MGTSHGDILIRTMNKDWFHIIEDANYLLIVHDKLSFHKFKLFYSRRLEDWLETFVNCK